MSKDNEKKAARSCDSCRHEMVCLVPDKLAFQLHEDGALEPTVDWFTSIHHADVEGEVEGFKDETYKEIDAGLRRILGARCARYSREPVGKDIKVEELGDALDDIKVDVPEAVLKALTYKARDEVLSYAVSVLLSNESSAYEVDPVPPVLEPYLERQAMKEADPDKHPSHRPEGPV